MKKSDNKNEQDIVTKTQTIGRALRQYRGTGAPYDSSFDEAVKRVRPDWSKKQELLVLAKSGAARPFEVKK